MSPELAPAPDQAVGWVIAFACFFINFIMAGLARTVGVLYVALVEVYGVSRETASSPFSIRVCVRNMSGPLVGLLGQKYGIRKITIIGGAVASLGSILCYFAPNVDWIIGFWGVIHGTGFGLSTVLHMMVISQYFDKYKASALGLGYSGDCFGTFVFPVIMEHLLSTYDIKGTFLILGGIVLNVVPLAMLLKKPPWLRETKKEGHFSENIVKASEDDLSLKNGTYEQVKEEGIINEGFVKSNDDKLSSDVYSKEQLDSLSIASDDPSLFKDTIRTKLRYTRTTFPATPSPRSGSFCKDLIRENMERHDSLPPLYERQVLDQGKIQNGLQKCVEYEENDDDNEKFQCGSNVIKGRTSSVVSQIALELVHRVRSASFASQIAQDGFITSIQQDQKEVETFDEFDSLELPYKANVERMNSNMSNFSNYQELILSVNGFTKPEEPTSWVIEKKETKSPGMINKLLRLNAKPIFVLISLSMAAYSFLFVGVLTIIIDYATDNDVSVDDGTYLIIGFSVTDLIGRLSFGLIIDRKLIKMKNYAGVTMLLMGTFVAVIPLNKSFNFMIVCMCMYGFVQGGSAIMYPILISYYMKKNEESIAMGCLNFIGGLFMLMLAPMIGYFRDNMNSYDWVFHIVGSLTLVVGVLWQFEPLIIRYQKRRKQRRLNYIIVTKL